MWKDYFIVIRIGERKVAADVLHAPGKVVIHPALEPAHPYGFQAKILVSTLKFRGRFAIGVPEPGILDGLKNPPVDKHAPRGDPLFFPEPLPRLGGVDRGRD